VTSVTVSAQDEKPFDPTAPSPAIIEQEDVIRGLDRLKELESRLTRLTQQVEQLTAELQRKDAELVAVRNEVQRKERLREAVPPFRLAALVQTQWLSIAVIEAGDRTYRVQDNQQLALVLSNGAKVDLTCRIKSADAVELTVPELSLTEVVTFHPASK